MVVKKTQGVREDQEKFLLSLGETEELFAKHFQLTKEKKEAEDALKEIRPLMLALLNDNNVIKTELYQANLGIIKASKKLRSVAQVTEILKDHKMLLRKCLENKDGYLRIAVKKI